MISQIRPQLSALIKAVIQADANYFYKQGFISARENDRVNNWLEGHDAPEIQYRIAEWLAADAQYFRDLESPIVKHHWYIAPLVWFSVKEMSEHLDKASRELKQ